MIPIHPLAEIFPAIEGEAFAALKADIAANGLSVPITLWRGAIIDGRNRYRALVELGAVTGATAGDIEGPPWLIPVERVDGLDANDLPGFVISRNLTRRHLSESQRAMVAARLSEMSAPGRPKRQDVEDHEVSSGRASAVNGKINPRPTHAARGGYAGGSQECEAPIPPATLQSHGDHPGQGLLHDRPAQMDHANAETPPIGGVPLTTAQAAKMLNVSPRSAERAKALFRGPVDLIEDVSAGRVAVSAAANALREVMECAPAQPAPPPPDPGAGGNPVGGGDVDAVYAQVKARLEAEKAAKLAAKKARRENREAGMGSRIAAANAALDGIIGAGRKFGVILADPEWEHQPWSDAGLAKAAVNHYPVSSIDDIKARPVAALAADDCVLLMWTTVPHLAQAFDVLAAWGFTYKSNMVWRKAYAGERQGMGYWTRINHEILLIATRGAPPCPAPGTQWGSVQDAPAGKHSEKPDFAHRFAEQFYPSVAKIEMNAADPSNPRAGWEAWGAGHPPANDPAEGDAGEAGPHPAADEQEDVDGRHKADHDAGERGAAEDDAGHPIYGRDYNKHGVLRIPPAETLAMPQAKGAKHARAVIELHPHEDGWLHATQFSAHEHGDGYGISPKWQAPAPTRDAALKAAITELAGRLGKSHGITAAADRAIMTWLEGLARQAGGDGALPARAAAKGRLSRRKAAPGDDPAGKTQPEHQGEPA